MGYLGTRKTFLAYKIFENVRILFEFLNPLLFDYLKIQSAVIDASRQLPQSTIHQNQECRGREGRGDESKFTRCEIEVE